MGYPDCPQSPSTNTPQTAVAPGTPPAKHAARPQRSRSPSPRRESPWIVAQWKHRVPEQDARSNNHLPGTAPPAAAAAAAGGAATTPRAQHRAALLADKKKQVAAEFAGAHDTIEHMLARCKLVQDTLHVGNPGSHSRSSSSSSWQPATPPKQASASGPALAAKHHKTHPTMHLTMRSRLLFEAPPAASIPAKPASGGNSSSSSSSLAHSELQDSRQQQQQAHKASWSSAVDLNPGFSFRPGTPERTAAVMRHTDAAAAALSPSAADMSSGHGVCLLTHREKLQAGIQELTGAFYKRIREEQWQRHQQQLQQLGWQQADLVPVSWFGL